MYFLFTIGEDDRLPRTLVMDVTMTHAPYGRTTQHTNGALTHRVSSRRVCGARAQRSLVARGNADTHTGNASTRQIYVDSPG